MSCPVCGDKKVKLTKLNLSNSKWPEFNLVGGCICEMCNTLYINVFGMPSGHIGKTNGGMNIENLCIYRFLPSEFYVVSKIKINKTEFKKGKETVEQFTTKNYKNIQIISKYDSNENKYYITTGTYKANLAVLKKYNIKVFADNDVLLSLIDDEAFEYLSLFILDDEEDDKHFNNFSNLAQSSSVSTAYKKANILYNPYQYLPWLYVFNEGKNSILISDEVGLGKTIEAGILITEQLTIYPKSKVLVVCPAFLCNKWKDELKEKFYLMSSIFGRKDYVETNVVILSVAKLKKFNENNNEYFDMVVVDEAHYFKNSSSARYKELNFFMRSNNSSRRVFMSATPINNSGNDFYSIRRLLGPEFVKTSTTKKEAYINIAKRTVNEVYVTLSEIEQQLYDTTDILDPFSGTIYRHIGASCLYALIKYASNNACSTSEVRNELMDALQELLVEDEDFEFELPKFKDEILKYNLRGFDSKLEVLKELIEKIDDKKIIIFSHYIETVKYLQSELSQKYRCEYIYANNFSNPSFKKDKKDRFKDAKNWFVSQDDLEKTILICSDSCKEGVDLDAASCLINYDLPFNPSILEQRIGRIDRMCQKNDMKIFNFHVENTYDDRLHMILTSKLLMINYYSEYGIGNPLVVTGNNLSPFDRFIKYFKKNPEFKLSNDDFDVVKKMLRKAKVKIENNTSKDEILNILENHKEDIVEVFNEKDIFDFTDEQLVKQKEILDRILNFPKYESGTIIIDDSGKSKLLKMFKDDPSKRVKLSRLIIDYENKLKQVEDSGNPMFIDEEDIKSTLVYSSNKSDGDTFISSELLEELRKLEVVCDESK